MLKISKKFVEQWARMYDEKFKHSKELPIEIEIREWLSQQSEPKYLDKDHFVILGWWKTRRQMKNYQANDETLVKDATRLAYQTSNMLLKLHILLALKGVGVPVASTILHFMQPDEFPIFDLHVKSSLKKAGKWSRSVDDASSDAWVEYVYIIRDISLKLRIHIRKLDKALWAYDKWGQ